MRWMLAVLLNRKARQHKTAFTKHLYIALRFGALFVFIRATMKAKRLKVRIRENSWLARSAAQNLGFDYVAMVYGSTIHLHNTSLERFFARPSWVIHELKHVEQYERFGTLRFLCCYFLEYVRKGYWNNALEAEARASESDYTLLSRYDLSDYADYMKAGYEMRRNG